MSVSALCTNLASIYRKVETKSSTTGSRSITWPTTATYADVRCLVQRATSFESRQQERETGSTNVNIYFPSGTDIRAKDRVTVSTGPFAGRTFYMNSMGNDGSGKGAYIVASGEELEGG